MATTATSVFPFRIGPINNIQPFTYREGMSHLQLLEKLRVYINETMRVEFNDEIERVIDEFNQGIEVQGIEFNTAFAEFVDTINDAVMAINNRVGPENMQRITLTADTVVEPETEWPDAHWIWFQVTQDNVGGHSLTFGEDITGNVDLYDLPNSVTDFAIVPNGDATWKIHQPDTTLPGEWLDTAGGDLIGDPDTLTRQKLNELFHGKTYLDPLIALLTTGKVSKGDDIVNVKNFGALGDGVADDTDAINAAIVAGAGRTILIPKGTYMIDAIANVGQLGQPTGVMVNTAGTTLRFENGAVFQAFTNTSTGYAVVQVTAADCVIEGGTIYGDMLAHVGNEGQWGHCIELAANADRSQIRGTRVGRAWGDGVLVWGRCEDVALIGVVADDNRRQGVSIIDAIRPRVIGCTFQNTGRTKYQAPAAGLDIEPDPGTARDVIDAVVADCIFRNNAGDGFLAVAQGREASGTVTGCLSVDNAGHGYRIVRGDVIGSPTIAFLACDARSNVGAGFGAEGGVVGVRYTSCNAADNGTHGFIDSWSDRAMLTGCTATNNGAAGVFVDSLSTNLVANSVTAIGNGKTVVDMSNFDVYGTAAKLNGCHSDGGSNVLKPQFGYGLRAGSVGTHLHGCTANGSYNTRAYSGTITGSFADIDPGDVSNAARGAFTPPRVLTADGPFTLNDSLVICNIGVGGMTSLPDPTLVRNGQQFLVKNVNAENLTVISQGVGKTIDGAANQVLAQWAKGVYISDGVQWLSL